MTVYDNAGGNYDASNVVYRDGRIIRYDKTDKTGAMTHIDYGLGAFRRWRRSAVGHPPAARLDLATVFLKTCWLAASWRAYEVAEAILRDRFGGRPRGDAGAARLPLKGQDMSYARQHLEEAKRTVIDLIDHDAVEKVAEILAATRTRGGRLFFLGVGGSAANCSHAVNDFRKICGFEAYAPTDNVSELTARTNDEGWASVFVEWLRGSRLRKGDTICIFSVGAVATSTRTSARTWSPR